MLKRIAIGTAVCALAAATAGCHKGAPQGQVAADVNGDEITLQELNTEIQSANVPDTADKKLVQQQALQRIIDRKLLVEAAKDAKIDKSSDFQAQKRRGEELLLAQLYAKQQAATLAVPTDADVQKFMTDHPDAFANREQLLLDQIRFRPPANPKALDALRSDHSLDAVGAHLTQMGIKFERGQNGLDTLQVPPAVLAQIEKLPAGEPFVLPAQGLVTVNVLTGKKPIATDPAQAHQIALASWREQKFGDLMTQRLKTLRSSAKINYQAGFQPPASQPGAAPAAK
jgi:peptidyl-prolyl cis-trans isomerase C